MRFGLDVFRSSPELAVFFFCKNTPTTEIYTLSLHDALPICSSWHCTLRCGWSAALGSPSSRGVAEPARSEEHTSELQSHSDLVCRLLLEKKKNRVSLPPSSVGMTT